MTAATTSGTASLEEVAHCPVCDSPRRQPLDTANMNSRDPERVKRLRVLLGDDFFVAQRLAICLDCDHVFQDRRPAPQALQSLYDRFSTAVAKATPTMERVFHYLLSDNAQDYVLGVAKTERFLDEIGALEGARSALEIRTYGGGLCALLRERGVEHVEAACLDEFDSQMANAIYGVDRTLPFSFAAPIEEFQPELPRYDLIVLYEGLTHSRDPAALLRWLADHLEPGGTVALMREPNTPRYRQFFALADVFNNFHMNLWTLSALDRLIQGSTSLPYAFLPDWHPRFASPLYVSVVLGDAARNAEGRALRPAAEPRYDPAYYQSWIRRDTDALRAKLFSIRRVLSRVGAALMASLREELLPAVSARLSRRAR